MAILVTILLRTNAAKVIAKPKAENTIVRFACSRLWGLPELVIYLYPPNTKNPVAINPAIPVRAVITLLIKEST